MDDNIKTNGRASLLSMDLDELTALMSSLGQPKYRAEQLFLQLHRGVPLCEITNISKKLREELAASNPTSLPSIRKKLVSKIDGTIKYLFELSDKNCVESVLMKYEHGYTICISSQVGCRMGCRFCASTIGGKVRDLTPDELLGQVLAAQLDAGERISNIVMMGIGEPLDNYQNVIKFLRLVSCDKGLNIGQRHISLSTCGVVPKIYELAEEDLQITLSISLHASDDETRSAIMPVNRKWNIHELLTACKAYYDKTGRRISFEYTLISGKNDLPEQASALADLLNKYLRTRTTTMPIHVNLIPVNEVEETGFVRASDKNIKEFAKILENHGVRATVRRKLGSDINASCGQLRRADEKGKTSLDKTEEKGN